MINRKLLYQFLPGLIPLFIFIIADEIWGTKVGLLVALLVGVLELGWEYYRNRKIEKFVLIDLCLIISMGLVSLWLENDLFFKLKPAVISTILLIILGVAVMRPQMMIQTIGARYLKEQVFNPYQTWIMQKSMRNLWVVTLIYTITLFAVTIWGSTLWWGFTNGPGFMIIYGLYFLIEFYIKKSQQKRLVKDEWLPLVDTKGQHIGEAPRSAVHNRSFLLHPVVHLHVINNGQLYLQKRSLKKLIQPGKWDTSVGGHVNVTQSIEQALKQEAFEELGIQQFIAVPICTYQWRSKVEEELVFVFKTNYSGQITTNPDEIETGKFWSFVELESTIGKNLLTPNFEYEYNLIKEHLTNYLTH